MPSLTPPYRLLTNCTALGINQGNLAIRAIYQTLRKRKSKADSLFTTDSLNKFQ